MTRTSLPLCYCLDNRLGVLGLDEYADEMLYGVEYPDLEPLNGVYGGSRIDAREGESIGVPGREFDCDCIATR